MSLGILIEMLATGLVGALGAVFIFELIRRSQANSTADRGRRPDTKIPKVA